MKRILIFAEGVTLAHVGRPIVLAKALQESEACEVFFACDARYSKFLDPLPVTKIALQSLSPESFLKRVSSGSPLFSRQELEKAVEEDIALIRQVRPDLVIGDMRLSLGISARVTKVAYATVTNAHWSTHAQHTFILPYHPLMKILGRKAVRRIFTMARRFFFALQNVSFNSVRRKYGLASIGWNYMRLHCEADYVFYADIPELVPTYRLPANHYYLGPLLWSPPVALPEWWRRLRPDMPVVYLGLGSSGASALLPDIVKALSELPIQLMVATAGRAIIADRPENVFVSDYLPGELCAERADLVINNGGAGGTYQALCAGKPVLGIVSLLDQSLFMHYVEAFGAGRWIGFDQITGATLKVIVTDFLSQDRIRDRARHFAEIYRNSQSTQEIVQHLVTSIIAHKSNCIRRE